MFSVFLFVTHQREGPRLGGLSLDFKLFLGPWRVTIKRISEVKWHCVESAEMGGRQRFQEEPPSLGLNDIRGIYKTNKNKEQLRLSGLTSNLSQNLSAVKLNTVQKIGHRPCLKQALRDRSTHPRHPKKQMTNSNPRTTPLLNTKSD